MEQEAQDTRTSAPWGVFVTAGQALSNVGACGLLPTRPAGIQTAQRGNLPFEPLGHGGRLA